MSFVTSLQLTFKRKLIKHRLIFPTKARDAKSETILFEDNQIVCFIRETFTRKKFSPSVLYLIRTVSPGMMASMIEGVLPGAEILLYVRGETKVRRTLKLLTDLIESGVDLGQMSDSIFEAIHSRNEANLSLDFLAERIVEDSKIK